MADQQLRTYEENYYLEPSLENARLLFQAYLRSGIELDQIIEMQREGQNLFPGEILSELVLREMIPQDENVFYEACEEVREKAETMLEELANDSAAMGWSFHEDPNQIIIAYFGEAVAMDGDILVAGDGRLINLTDEQFQEKIAIPDNYKLTRKGGDIPSDEQHVSKDTLLRALSDQTGYSINIINQCLNFDTGYSEYNDEIPISVSGSSEIYRKDPLNKVYKAKSIDDIMKALQHTSFALIDGEYPESGIDWDKVPHWGEETDQVSDLLRRNNRWEGLFTWDTTKEDPIYLMFEMSHDGKRKLVLMLDTESQRAQREAQNNKSDENA